MLKSELHAFLEKMRDYNGGDVSEYMDYFSEMHRMLIRIEKEGIQETLI